MKQVSIAKISRPNASGIIPRKRLFRLFDSAKKRPILWVTGPAGSGKTSLVASYLDARKLPCLWYQIDVRDGDAATFFYYLGLAAKKAAPRSRRSLPLLTPDYVLDLATFTKRYFEELFSRLKLPGILVFDNYQDAPPDSSFQDVMRAALSTVPDAFRVIVISRGDPTPQLARLRVDRKMEIMGWEDIRFTLEESKELVQSGRKESLPTALIKQLHTQTDGWAAGLVLLSKTLVMKIYGADLPARQSPSELFEYFAGELFDRADAETRNFLLRTSFLTTLTASMAERLSGFGHAARLLADLRRNHCFITSTAESIYQYHPLFRDFLTVRARELFLKEELAAIRRSAASILKESGRHEDAAELFREGGDWQSFIELTLEQAPALVAEGRLQTLSEWLTAIPEPLFAVSPRLWYWFGASRLPFNPKEGLRHFEKAFDLFQKDEDMTGALLAWSGAINAVLLGWDDFAPLDTLIAWFYERTDRLAHQSPEVEAECASSMAGALVWRQPDHPDMEEWVERALNVTRTSANLNLKLRVCINASFYYIWTGDIPNALMVDKETRQMTRKPTVSPLMLITCKWLEAGTSYLSAASYESGLQAVSEALETAQAHGVHTWDHMIYALGAYGNLLKGDLLAASAFLDKMKSVLSADQSHSYCHYHYMAAWHNVLAEDYSSALSNAELALKLALEIRSAGLYFPEFLCRFAVANILCEKKSYQEAGDQLAVAEDIARRLRSKIFDFMQRFTKARVELAQGNDTRGLDMLQSALELGRSHNFINMLFWWQPSVMADLCSRALEAGIETEYVKRIIRTHNLTPGDDSHPGPVWPWPVRITALGRFEVLKDGKPINFTRKVQHKPLLLLKALIAHGGREVPEETISDLLWPDSEGDAAHTAFSTTLHRLRALIGNNALLLRKRSLSLDRRYCWVDAWAFEREVESLERGMRSEGPEKREAGDGVMQSDMPKRTEKALELYRGQFLPGDAGEAWTAKYRERLRNKFLRLVLQHGVHLEKRSQWRKAEKLFARALENDELTEELYQHLMLCFQKQGRKADAIRVYNNCRTVLSSVLGITPSAKTEALYAAIRK